MENRFYTLSNTLHLQYPINSIPKGNRIKVTKISKYLNDSMVSMNFKDLDTNTVYTDMCFPAHYLHYFEESLGSKVLYGRS